MTSRTDSGLTVITDIETAAGRVVWFSMVARPSLFSQAAARKPVKSSTVKSKNERSVCI
jgi:hypothetical protein